MTRVKAPPVIHRKIEAIKDQWGLIESLLESIEHDYQWAYNVAYGAGREPPRDPEDEARRQERMAKARKRGEKPEPYVLDYSDPTGEAVASGFRGRMRAACVESEKLVNQARAALLAASQNLDSVFGEKLAPELGPHFPRVASKEDLEAAKEALRRRRLRGEGYGETSVPRGEP